MAFTEKLPSGRYRAGYRLPNGEKRHVSGTFTHKRAARDAAIEAEGKVKRSGWRDPRAGETTWGDWHELWWPSRIVEPNTLKSESSLVKNHIMPRWGDVELASIKRHDVQAWATELVTTNLGDEDDPRFRAPSSVRRTLNVFVSSLTAAMDAELVVGNPAVRIKLPPMPHGREVFFTLEQYSDLANAVPSRADRAVLDFLVGTGVRYGEMAGFHIHNLDLTNALITVSDTTDGTEIKPYPKGRRSRHVPLVQWVVDYLDVPESHSCGLKHRGKRGCPSGLLFPAVGGGVRDNRNFAQRVFAPAIKKANLEHLGATIHDLRHTYASWLIQDGVPLERVAELLGHASIVTAQRYAHLRPPSSDDVAHALKAPRGTNMGQTTAIRANPGLHAVASE